MSRRITSTLAQRHLKYTLLAVTVTSSLVIAVALKPSLLFIWVCSILILLTILATRFHVKQGRVHKDTVIEYILVLIASLAVLIGATRH